MRALLQFIKLSLLKKLIHLNVGMKKLINQAGENVTAQNKINENLRLNV